MANTLSNNFKEQVLLAAVNFSSDVFKIALMTSGFSFDQDAHSTYADVSASELATANGYTVGGATLSGQTVTQDDVENEGDVVFNNATWTAAGGSIGPAAGAIIYDDTHASDAVIGYIDFGGNQTAVDGSNFVISGIALSLA